MSKRRCSPFASSCQKSGAFMVTIGLALGSRSSIAIRRASHAGSKRMCESTCSVYGSPCQSDWARLRAQGPPWLSWIVVSTKRKRGSRRYGSSGSRFSRIETFSGLALKVTAAIAVTNGTAKEVPLTIPSLFSLVAVQILTPGAATSI
jgi:hypothetical protein